MTIYSEASNDPLLERMNALEKQLTELIDEFEKKYPGWTVEMGSYSLWSPVRKESFDA